MTRPHTIVVTGAGSGIGRALAVGFTAAGHRVAGLGRTAAALAETGALTSPGLFSFSPVDVSAAGEVEGAMRRIAAEVGPIDVLICNAAVQPRVRFLDQPADDWAATIATNLCGVANCCRAVLPGMLERNFGRIVIVGSITGSHPSAGSSAYSASKSALHDLTKIMAAEIDRQRYPDVLINEFDPGATKTAMSEAGDDPAAAYPRIRRLIDLPRGGPTGRLFHRDKEVVLNEGLRAAIKRRFFGPTG